MRQTIAHIKQSLTPLYGKAETDALIRIIFEHIMGYSTVDIILHKDTELSSFVKQKIDNVIAELLQHRPIQYIFGEAPFYGLNFKVNRHTLIPRPETQELVQMIVNENTATDLRVLDIGTGSGCIACSLARSLKFAQVSAVDISSDTLTVARENAERLKVTVNFSECDILTANPHADSFDIIVSNPPYICEQERVDMEQNVLDYEPDSALFVPNEDPLRFYRAITKYSQKSLPTNGKLYFEINSLYYRDVVSLMREHSFEDVIALRDYKGNYRFVKGVKV